MRLSEKTDKYPEQFFPNEAPLQWGPPGPVSTERRDQSEKEWETGVSTHGYAISGFYVRSLRAR